MDRYISGPYRHDVRTLGRTRPAIPGQAGMDETSSHTLRERASQRAGCMRPGKHAVSYVQRAMTHRVPGGSDREGHFKPDGKIGHWSVLGVATGAGSELQRGAWPGPGGARSELDRSPIGDAIGIRSDRDRGKKYVLFCSCGVRSLPGYCRRKPLLRRGFQVGFHEGFSLFSLVPQLPLALGGNIVRQTPGPLEALGVKGPTSRRGIACLLCSS